MPAPAPAPAPAPVPDKAPPEVAVEESSTAPGAALYSPRFLRFYSIFVQHIVYRFGLRTPISSMLLPFYSEHMLGPLAPGAANSPATSTAAASSTTTSGPHGKRRVLDIGPGPGYYLANVRPMQPAHTDPTSSPSPSAKAGLDAVITDLNAGALQYAAGAIHKAHSKPRKGVLPVTCTPVQADLLGPDSAFPAADAIGGRVDAIALMYVLHCVPGPQERKARALVRCARALLKYPSPDADAGPGGPAQTAPVLIGVTILGRGGSWGPLNWPVYVLMKHSNRKGWFDNWGDDAMGFVEPLEEAFEHVKWKVHGRVLFFEARGLRRL